MAQKPPDTDNDVPKTLIETATITGGETSLSGAEQAAAIPDVGIGPFQFLQQELNDYNNENYWLAVHSAVQNAVTALGGATWDISNNVNEAFANVSAFPEPLCRVQARYREPMPFAKLSEGTAAAIRKTILSVSAKQQTNGYELTVLHFIAHARCLLLVRDKNDRQWRASGYFVSVSGTNRDPARLHVDKKGMMTDAQSPIALPAVKFLPEVVRPKFTTGWGEDSDGDGLPDIYEVLVAHTKPDDADADDTGILDGYKVFADDGWNNWEKFRYRANPFQKCEPPPAAVLKQPNGSEMFEAQTRLKTDLPFKPQPEVRTNGAAYFQPLQFPNENFLPRDASGHILCDVRVSWKVPPPRP